MKVSEALISRISTRSFLDKPVLEETVRDILLQARYAPSGGNLQPWKVYVVMGEARDELVSRMQVELAKNPAGEGYEYLIYPPKLWEPYRSRRFKCGEDMYATIDVSRDDNEKRAKQFVENFRFFGAPVGLFFTLDRRMQQGQWADLGMFMQSIMLLAQEMGLNTCSQESWSIFYKTVRKFLDIPDNEILFCGMALGYGNPDHRINRLRTERADLAEFVTFIKS